MVKVYQAYLTSDLTAETIQSAHKGTMDWISRLPAGRPVPGTEEEVAETDLDDQGRYVGERKSNAHRT